MPLLAQKNLSHHAKWQQSIPEREIIASRRHLDPSPGLSFKEHKTSRYLADILESCGNRTVTRPTATSVIGIWKGDKPGKTVAFRADIDAIPVPEQTGLHDFTSKVPGVSHTCGHDAHTAILLGTAATLAKMQNQRQGTVYFI